MQRDPTLFVRITVPPSPAAVAGCNPSFQPNALLCLYCQYVFLVSSPLGSTNRMHLGLINTNLSILFRETHNKSKIGILPIMPLVLGYTCSVPGCPCSIPVCPCSIPVYHCSIPYCPWSSPGYLCPIPSCPWYL